MLNTYIYHQQIPINFGVFYTVFRDHCVTRLNSAVYAFSMLL